MSGKNIKQYMRELKESYRELAEDITNNPHAAIRTFAVLTAYASDMEPQTPSGAMLNLICIAGAYSSAKEICVDKRHNLKPSKTEARNTMLHTGAYIVGALMSVAGNITRNESLNSMGTALVATIAMIDSLDALGRHYRY